MLLCLGCALPGLLFLASSLAVWLFLLTRVVAVLLAVAGAKEVSGYATHAIFPDGAWKKFVSKEHGGQGASLCLHSSVCSSSGLSVLIAAVLWLGAFPFKYFWVTNSHPTAGACVR